MKNKEEIVASKLYDLLADIRTDPTLVGRYFAQTARAEVYERFDEMTSSARQEKQNRIDWIKDIIIGEKKMTTSFDNKVIILSQFFTSYGQEGDFVDFILERNLGFPMAMAYHFDFIIGFTDEGAELIEQTFDDLLELLELEDEGWEDVYELEKSAGLEGAIQ
mgnify:CR=1 FL=1